jgi:chromosome segregation ATPase
MDEYFQISDKTRTLEHQYATLLNEKQRLETALVEEDFLELHSKYEGLARCVSEIDVNKYEQEIEELKTQVDSLGKRKVESDHHIVRLNREKEDLAEQLRRESSSAEDKELLRGLGKEVKHLSSLLGGSMSGDVHVVLQDIKREIEALGAKAAEEQMKKDAEMGNILKELGTYRRSDKEYLRRIEELTREVDELRRENRRLTEKQALLPGAEDLKSRKEKGVETRKEVTSDAFTVEDKMLCPETYVEEPWNITLPKPKPVRKKVVSQKRAQASSQVKGAKPADAQPAKAVLEPENINNVITDIKKAYVPASLLKPENSSFFADLSFNHSSPVVKNPRINPPKKNL